MRYRIRYVTRKMETIPATSRHGRPQNVPVVDTHVEAFATEAEATARHEAIIKGRREDGATVLESTVQENLCGDGNPYWADRRTWSLSDSEHARNNP